MLKKTKTFCTGDRTVTMETSKFPCSVCRTGVGSNSILGIKGIKDATEYRSALARQNTLSVGNILLLLAMLRKTEI